MRTAGLKSACVVCYLSSVMLVAALAIWGALHLFTIGVQELVLPGASSDKLSAVVSGGAVHSVTAPVTEERGGRLILTQDEWHERIRAKDFWTGRRSGPPSPYTPGGYAPMPFFNSLFNPGERGRNSAWEDTGGETYRTVCVRLCDGFYWPVSFSTTRNNFDRDQATCERSCGSPARLYVYRNPGGEPDEMTTVDQEPYSRLPTAFKYRTSYDAQCRCGPQPWEREALDRHRIYALESALKKGDRSAAQQIVDIKAKQEADRRRLAQARLAAVTAVRNGMLAVRQPTAVAVVQSAGDVAVLPLQGTGRAFANLPVTVIRGPVVMDARGAPIERPVGPVAAAKPGPVIIMRLGVSGPQQDVSRKAEPKAGRASRRDRQNR